MAVVNSVAIGQATQSAGEVTYRGVRGRTIMSRRVTQNKSKTVAQKSQRSLFGVFTSAFAEMAPYINIAFYKTKYGTARNNFVKRNMPAFVQPFKESLPRCKGNAEAAFCLAFQDISGTLTGAAGEHLGINSKLSYSSHESITAVSLDITSSVYEGEATVYVSALCITPSDTPELSSIRGVMPLVSESVTLKQGVAVPAPQIVAALKAYKEDKAVERDMHIFIAVVTPDGKVQKSTIFSSLGTV